MTTREQFFQDLARVGILSEDEARSASVPGGSASALIDRLTAAGHLTDFQAEHLHSGRDRDLFLGNYIILDQIGTGGMGTVFKARHRRMKRLVALKLLRPEVASSATFLARFQREVEAVSQLNHPNVVMAYDADIAEAGYFLIMELVNGQDLASTVVQRGPLPVAEAIDVITQAARGLAAAHDSGLIHRDVKPANLLRSTDGVVKVTDLGLARSGISKTDSSVTQAGGIVGTVDYMSPEQAFEPNSLDHRSDIYSLGATLYFLLTGRPPYRADSVMKILVKHREEKVPSLSRRRPDVPADLEHALTRMMAKSPADRFSSMTALIDVLGQVEAAVTHRPVSASNEPRSVSESDNSDTVDLLPPRPVETSAILVEPSRTQASIITNRLHEAGIMDVRVVQSGVEAIRLSEEARPTLIVTAHHLDDMTGPELATALRAKSDFGTVGFVLICSQGSTRIQSSAVTQFQQTPRSVVLAKPFDTDQLKEAIANASLHGDHPDSPPERTVLVVDDSATARGHIRRVLQRLGQWSFTEAEDGQEALERLRASHVDLLVTDYQMPRLDGLGLVAAVRREWPKLPMIVCTSVTDPEPLAEFRRIGDDALLTITNKEFDPEKVRVALTRLIGS